MTQRTEISGGAQRRQPEFGGEDEKDGVYGFGMQKTPESFRQACRRFIYTENLLPVAEVTTLEEGPSRKALEPPRAAILILNKAIAQLETEDGWVGLGVVGQRLANIASDEERSRPGG